MAKRSKKELNQIERQYKAFENWAAKAVAGPGDSEYDCYAYDLPLPKPARSNPAGKKTEK